MQGWHSEVRDYLLSTGVVDRTRPVDGLSEELVGYVVGDYVVSPERRFFAIGVAYRADDPEQIKPVHVTAVYRFSFDAADALRHEIARS